MDLEADLLAKDLGTGRGTAENLAQLRAGQLTKRKLMLRMLLGEASAKDAGAVRQSGLRDALGHLRAAPADELLAYPNLGVWLARSLRRVASPADNPIPLWADLGYLAWLTAAHAVMAGRPAQRTVVVRDGVIMLPWLGLVRAGEPGEHGLAELTTGDGALTVVFGDRFLIISDLDDESDARWLPLRRLGTTAAGRAIILDDLDPFRDPADPYTAAQLKEPPPRLSAAEARTWSETYAEAESILHRDYPEYADGIDQSLQAVVPLTAAPVANGVSNTSFDAFGGVNMSAAAGPYQFALSLIHECQHAKLATLTDQVDLQEPSSVKDLYAPWRDDPRPLSGLLQGIYAHIGVTDFWRVYRTTAIKGAALAEIEFARWRTQVNRAVAVAASSPLLTSSGRIFVESMTQAITHWADEPVSEDAAVLAAESAIGHWVAWRVRNLTVDDQALDELRALRHAGQPAGPLPVAALSRSAGPQERRTRLPASYLKLVGESNPRFAELEIPAADLAYADGDLEAALRLYLAELATAPAAPEPWDGIALCLRRLRGEAAATAVLERPEVVAGLHQRTGGDVVDLVDWLAR